MHFHFSMLRNEIDCVKNLVRVRERKRQVTTAHRNEQQSEDQKTTDTKLGICV